MNVRQISYVAIFTALAVVIHYLEGLIPPLFPIPGFKLGLANLVGTFVLFYFGWTYYISMTLVRVVLVGLISTGFGTAFFLSLSGAILSSVATLILFFFTRTSVFGVSTVSAFFHVVGQILMYMLLTSTPYLITYLPFLAGLSMLAGFLLGFVLQILLRRLPKFRQEKYRRHF